MTTPPQPPPEAQLITELREQPPRKSMRQAAEEAGISESRWRQIEHGVRYFRGDPYPETGPAQTVAKMAQAVGATPAQLTERGRADAAGELEALLSQHGMTGRQARSLAERARRDLQ